MSTETLIAGDVRRSDDDRQLEAPTSKTSLGCFRHCSGDDSWVVFEELPTATIVSVSRPETGEISPILLSYTIEFQYKQFKWQLVKKASQVLYLHFALKKRAIIEEFHEKQEQVKEWLQSLGIVDHMAVVQDDDEPDDGAIPLHHEGNLKNRNVPSKIAFSILKPTIGRQQTVSDKAKVAMQGYLNHFLGNMDIVNCREVCRFMEVSKYSFSREYGPKLKEGYVLVKHFPKGGGDGNDGLCPLKLLNWCTGNWRKVWAVLKPGFLAFLEDPFDTELLDIIVFDLRPPSTDNEKYHVHLAEQIHEQNPLRYAFKVCSGNRSIKMRVTSSGKVTDWVASINDAGLRTPDGWCSPHRFGSYAPMRGSTDDGSQAQWFIDGKDAFEAIASAIEKAKSEILITGWWLCPELYLRRPFQSHSSSRLDLLLETKAKEGVKIYILLYKEVLIALKINSSYSKRKLLNIHENIRVLRYPDHLSTGIYLWSHHEKLVIVDYQICFLGGLDLCFGRYDTAEHQVNDFPPHIWPGKDYYNPRESEPNSWEDSMKDELDREKYPRMPWHDVHCAIWGPPCRDVARHFVQRWNHAKRSKAPNAHTIPLLMPHHYMVLPHYMGSKEIVIKNRKTEDRKSDVNPQDSFSSRSPLEDIPLLLPKESDMKESDTFASSDVDKNTNVLHLEHNINAPSIEATNSLHFSSHNSKSESVATQMKEEEPNSADPSSEMNLDGEAELNISDDFSGGVDSYQDVHFGEYGQVGPRMACSCQIIRSVSQWSAGTSQTEDSIHNAYCSLIEKAEHFVYIENQFFISGMSGDETIENRVLDSLYRRIIQAHKEQKCFRVIIVMPLIPGFQGGIDDGGAATVRAIMHWQYRTISGDRTSILHMLNSKIGTKTKDYISFYGLRSHGRLSDNGPLTTSQVYVHSKLMIVDDRITLIGSSNINDRSLLGSRDSEIGIVIEDNDFVDSSMNGQPWVAGKFTYSLRCSLWAEHLGLSLEEINQISDPILEETYKTLWLSTAEANSKIYHDVFRCIPNEQIHSRAALRQQTTNLKEELGYTTIDLGVAREKMQKEVVDEQNSVDAMERLKLVRGHLVLFPLEFMKQEDLRPFFNEGEFYASPQVFH